MNARFAIASRVLTAMILVLALPSAAAEGGSIVGWGIQVVGVDLSGPFDAVAAGGRAAWELEQLREQMPAGSSEAEQVEELWAELVTRRTGSYPPPMLLDQIDYLYGMVTKADSRPSRDAYTRYAELKEMLDALLEEVRQLRRGVAEDW